MAYFEGPKGNKIWHKRPTMYGWGDVSTWRSGSTVYIRVQANLSTYSGSTASKVTSVRIIGSDGHASPFYQLSSNYSSTRIY